MLIIFNLVPELKLGGSNWVNRTKCVLGSREVLIHRSVQKTNDETWSESCSRINQSKNVFNNFMLFAYNRSFFISLDDFSRGSKTILN